MVLPFLFPAALILWNRGSGRGEEPSGGDVLRLIQIRLTMVGFALYVYETLVVRFCACAVSLNSAEVRETGRSPESPIRLPQTQSAFHRRAQRNVFRRRDVRLSRTEP
jgi:hypothetical protein